MEHTKLLRTHAIIGLYHHFWHQEYHHTWLRRFLILQYLIIALILAFTFFQISDSYYDADVRLNFLILVRLSITLTSINVFTVAFRGDRQPYIQTIHHGPIKFRAVSVYFAKFLVFAIFRVPLFIPFSAIIYPIINLRRGFKYAVLFTIILMLQQLAAISLGLLIAAACKDLNLAGTVTGVATVITILLSGSVTPYEIVPKGLRWLHYLSLSYYAHQALANIEFSGRTFPDNIYLSGDQFLKDNRLGQLTTWTAIGGLIGYLLLCNIAGMISLHLTTRSKLV